jgi:hypothetical protein
MPPRQVEKRTLVVLHIGKKISILFLLALFTEQSVKTSSSVKFKHADELNFSQSEYANI